MLFRNELTPESWHRWNLPEYWGMLALCATVFVLILSFRVSRVAERTLSEDTLMLEIFREAEHYVRTGVFKAETIGGGALGASSQNSGRSTANARRMRYGITIWQRERS